MQLLSQPLPEDVKLLTLELRHGYGGEYILRLEHIYDVDENIILSRPGVATLNVNYSYYDILLLF